MTISHKQQICIVDTHYYHFTSCCVCHAFMCGEENLQVVAANSVET
ncbi:MAG: hypothetical protein ABW139_19670 [Candidatus Thiodiazotropha sp. DIVDIV]